MKAGLFVDTGGWMAMADAADPAHLAIRRARDECLRDGGILVSTDYVTDEALTLIRLRLGLRCGLRLVGSSRRQLTASLGVDRSGTFGKSADLVLPMERQRFLIHGLHEFRRHEGAPDTPCPDHGPPFSSGGL